MTAPKHLTSQGMSVNARMADHGLGKPFAAVLFGSKADGRDKPLRHQVGETVWKKRAQRPLFSVAMSLSSSRLLQRNQTIIDVLHCCVHDIYRLPFNERESLMITLD